MKTNYTKGEWKVESYLPTRIRFKNGIEINVVHYDTQVKEAEADAKLIAATPDLLENLMRIIDRIEENDMQSNFPSAYIRAKEAIKKAIE